jgi:hypothetical protein
MGEAVLAHVSMQVPLSVDWDVDDSTWKVAKERGVDIHVESAGTENYHVEEEPDERWAMIMQS